MPSPPSHESLGLRPQQPEPSLPSQGWADILLIAQRSSERLARRGRLEGVDTEDLACEAVARLFATEKAGIVVEFHATWIEGTIRHLLADILRDPRKAALRTDEARALEKAVAGPWADPARSALLGDLQERAPALFGRLPRPCAEIAELQYIKGATRAEIAGWLGAWRGVGVDEARCLLRRTHTMLRAIGRGDDLRSRWPEGWNPRKNPWLSTPPPISPTLGLPDSLVAPFRTRLAGQSQA